MEKELIVSVKAKTQDGEGFLVHYYLLQGETEFGLEYGVLVTMEHSIMKDSCAVHTLSPQREEAITFIRDISNGIVTPVSLYDIVDNYLGVV